ncbi:MAG: hypothetical protein KIS84_00070 [Dokdonella sp.]|nr:hypothetical protein [Dokdonella sp.]
MLALLAAALSACASTGGKVKAKGVSPEDRALERWNLLIERKAELAYDYMSPGKRAIEKREDYASAMNNRPVRWKKVMLHSKTCAKEDTCTIILQVDVEVPMMGGTGMATSLGFPEETWIRGADGIWYYLGPTPRQAGQ